MVQSVETEEGRHVGPKPPGGGRLLHLPDSGSWQFVTQEACMHAFLVAQLVKNLSAMQETPVRFLGWEDLLEKG